MPSAEVKLQILQLAIRRLTDAGYVFIGMDHFAKPDDELASCAATRAPAQEFPGLLDPCRGRPDGLRRFCNQQKVGPTYSQNVRTLDEYYDALDNGQLPIMRGLELTAD